jgi:hypothetical protein
MDAGCHLVVISPGPLRSGRARFAHPAPQTHGFATWRGRSNEWHEPEATGIARESWPRPITELSRVRSAGSTAILRHLECGHAD